MNMYAPKRQCLSVCNPVNILSKKRQKKVIKNIKSQQEKYKICVVSEAYVAKPHVSGLAGPRCQKVEKKKRKMAVSE